MKIAIIHPQFRSIGGAENVILWLAQQWSLAGHQVCIFSMYFTDSTQKLAAQYGFKCKSIKFPGIPHDDLRRRNLKIMGWWLRRHIRNFDIINVHNFPATIWAAEATRYGQSSFPPVIWACHEPPRTIYFDKLNDPFHDTTFDPSNIEKPLTLLKKDRKAVIGEQYAVKLDQAAAASMSAIICNSQNTAGMVKTVYGIDADMSYFGVPIPQSSPAQKPIDHIVMSMATRLQASKNVHTAIRAVAVMLEKNPSLRSQFKFQVVGNGGLEDDLKIYTRNLGLEDVVDFLGFVTDSDLIKVYRDSHFMLYIPIMEPLGLVPIEAAFQRTPSIVSNHGGPLETVIHGKTGWHVDPYDVNGIAAAISRWCSDLNYVAQLGDNAHEFAKKTFNIETTAQYFLSVFNDRLSD